MVEDTNAPVISCGTNFTVEWPNSWTFTPPTAVYACSGASVPVNILSSNVNLTHCGTTNTIVWSAINQCNDAMATCTQVVTVVCPCQETNGIIKYTQLPNTTQGYDVWNSTTLPPNADDGPWLLADDFVCTNTGYITDIHIWGSWLNNATALDSITFWLGLFTDNPTNATSTYSTPGQLVWSQCFARENIPKTSGVRAQSISWTPDRRMYWGLTAWLGTIASTRQIRQFNTARR